MSFAACFIAKKNLAVFYWSNLNITNKTNTDNICTCKSQILPVKQILDLPN